VKTNVATSMPPRAVASLIKVVLSLPASALPAQPAFRHPNPRIELDASPFFVVAEARPWSGHHPRRAGVSSFGIGGTNAHCVVEEGPGVRRDATPPAPTPWPL